MRVPSNPRQGSWLIVLALSALLTGVNAVKPLQTDDVAYECYARQMAQHPLDPYGFAIFWYSVPEPANQVLAPPVFPYTWALARRLVGETPWAWKLALGPWAFLLVRALWQLLHRFAPDAGQAPLALLVLSPVILPGLNLMLDLPSLALALTAVSLFLRAVDRDSLALAAGAGLVCGLALETKYPAGTALGVMLAATVLSGRWRLWPVAVLVTFHVFLTWELLTAFLYGRSHFLESLAQQSGDDRAGMLTFLPSYLGGVGGPILLLGLAALGLRWRGLLAGAALLLLVYGAIAVFDVTFVNPLPVKPVPFPLAEVLFDAVGLTLLAVSLLLGWRQVVDDRVRGRGPGLAGREGLLLLSWVVVELLGFAVLTPFPATRRVLALCVPLTLLAARSLSLSPRPVGLAVNRGLVAFSALLGLSFAALDVYGAWIVRHALFESAALIAERGGGGRIWYLGHWGFQFYGQEAGMHMLVPYSEPGDDLIPLPPTSRLCAGDWVVVPDGSRVPRPAISLLDDKAVHHEIQRVAVLNVGEWLPIRVNPCYYGGRVPFDHQPGPELRIEIFRVRQDFVPCVGIAPDAP